VTQVGQFNMRKLNQRHKMKSQSLCYPTVEVLHGIGHALQCQLMASHNNCSSKNPCDAIHARRRAQHFYMTDFFRMVQMVGWIICNQKLGELKISIPKTSSFNIRRKEPIFEIILALLMSHDVTTKLQELSVWTVVPQGRGATCYRDCCQFLCRKKASVPDDSIG